MLKLDRVPNEAVIIRDMRIIIYSLVTLQCVQETVLSVTFHSHCDMCINLTNSLHNKCKPCIINNYAGTSLTGSCN